MLNQQRSEGSMVTALVAALKSGEHCGTFL